MYSRFLYIRSCARKGKIQGDQRRARPDIQRTVRLLRAFAVLSVTRILSFRVILFMNSSYGSLRSFSGLVWSVAVSSSRPSLFYEDSTVVYDPNLRYPLYSTLLYSSLSDSAPKRLRFNTNDRGSVGYPIEL
jgi:hypothetical protein